MDLRPGLHLDDEALAEFAVRNGIRRLSLFGSALRDDFGPDSDVDLLVEFEPDRIPGLLQIAAMELELEHLVGRQVELRTYDDLSRQFRDDVVRSARPLHAA
ncbi:hypothetical protein EV383_4604 [Pseudonocardia sediminis]|uniref:Polymerase nucleotidyl transferase domain-containing protein n=1 Tax=Pseudonocardia sediminis TaxID=1397368 RepID=A0A4Q7V2G3_PSEST|nr:nucleotidyltransferase domain-containing protein [Pseudonocardia sediminis]RZT87678.1 hypothetical protein EV383_4604 [Pseudonocardia sediminis]